MSKVAVVILNWNGEKLLKQFLPFLVSYTTIDDVVLIVADNHSTDHSVSFVKENYPQIQLIELPENYGFAEGYNRALAQLEAEYFVLLNSDVEVVANWLMPMIEYLDANLDVVAAQPKILAQRDKTHFEYAGAAGGFLDKYGYPFCRGRIFGNIESDLGQYNTVVDILWASGACLLIRAKDYFEVGGLDTSFFAHMEEIDMCWRLNARGKRIVCVPESMVYHVGGATLAEESPRKTFLNFRNNLLMLYKNLPEKRVKKVLRIRRWLDYLAAAKYMLTGKVANAKEIHRAHKEFKKIKDNYAEIRKDNLAKIKNEALPTIYPKSILVSTHLKRFKEFSKLNFGEK